tara:strand:+ start:2402 stop:2872 length:471 start_codon:yes stop_codon:yes gene_type:complete
MIIQCINCDKKFLVNSKLIPDKGRTIQCGSCNHVWFYVPQKEKYEDQSIEDKNKKILDQDLITKETNEIETINQENDLNIEDKKNYEITKYKPKTNFSLSLLLSYILVSIISFIAVIVVIDTFKSPLYQIFPKLEFILFSLFEILKDIKLFIKDLI